MKKIVKILLLSVIILVFSSALIIVIMGNTTHKRADDLHLSENEKDNNLSDANPKDGLEYNSDKSNDLVGENKERKVPILMYHSLLSSQTGTYIVSPKNFENDVIWMKEHGYTPVFLNDLKSFTLGNGDLPEKPIVITFDDGHYNNLYYALPILKKHEVKAQINIIGAFTEYSTSSGDKDNPNYSHLTWDEVHQLAESGYFEIGNHTYNMHKFKPRYGIMQCAGENFADYRSNLEKDLVRMQNSLSEKSKIQTTIFAYPFGKYNETNSKIVQDLGFDILLTCYEGTNIIKRGDSSALLALKRYNREGKMSTESFFSKIKL